jgi:hypothetical protein
MGMFMLPTIVQCFTPRTAEFPLTQWSESKFSSAHGWDIYNNTVVIYDPKLVNHPAIVANYLNDTFLPCPPPGIIEQIFNYPYGAPRRKMLLSWINANKDNHIILNHHIWLNDPDINIMLDRKKINYIYHNTIGPWHIASAKSSPLGICACSQFCHAELFSVVSKSSKLPSFLRLTAN